MHRSLPALLALSVCAPAMAQSSDVVDMGREQSAAFFAGDVSGIWEAFTAEMQADLGSLEDFTAFHDQVMADLGTEETVLEETADSFDGLDIYTRIGQWSDFDTPIQIVWVFNPDGGIDGFLVQPEPQAAHSIHLDYETQADLRLPFEGEWHVFWGGREIAENYHAADPAQRFALDLVVHEDGQSYSGDRDALEAYHCWGREILAPAGGRVIATVNDLPDQPIGSSDPQNPAGNHVILAVAENEYAFLAHLQQGSVTVQQGDEIAQGEILGLCGNSGNSSEPHLHFHLQTTPDLYEGEGLPAQFQDYIADGEPVERGEPVRGETVSLE